MVDFSGSATAETRKACPEQCGEVLGKERRAWKTFEIFRMNIVLVHGE
jgi:predicted nucleic acid-binding Zn ribbon protein